MFLFDVDEEGFLFSSLPYLHISLQTDASESGVVNMALKFYHDPACKRPVPTDRFGNPRFLFKDKSRFYVHNDDAGTFINFSLTVIPPLYRFNVPDTIQPGETVEAEAEYVGPERLEAKYVGSQVKRYFTDVLVKASGDLAYFPPEEWDNIEPIEEVK